MKKDLTTIDYLMGILFVPLLPIAIVVYFFLGLFIKTTKRDKCECGGKKWTWVPGVQKCTSCSRTFGERI